MEPKKKQCPGREKPYCEGILREKVEMQDLQNDPLGSYTGKPADPMDLPVQDADDL